MSGIKNQPFAVQSWHFAILSDISYQAPDAALPRFAALGYKPSEIQYLDVDNAQGYILETPWESVVVCRGTQLDEIADSVGNFAVWHSWDSQLGFVHTGFLTSANLLWPQVKQHLQYHQHKPTYFTGHSLGAAMSTIMAVRMLHTPELVKPQALFTYGSPKLFTIIGARTISSGVLHWRWVNNLDIVPCMPGFFMGYGHCGTQYYINRWGNVVNYSPWRRKIDQIQALRQVSRCHNLGYLTSHKLTYYIAALERFKNDIVLPENENGSGSVTSQTVERFSPDLV
jgi:triacylglycerol lipase